MTAAAQRAAKGGVLKAGADKSVEKAAEAPEVEEKAEAAVSAQAASASVASAAPAATEAPKAPVVRVVKAADREAEEKQRMTELASRRKAAEAEAAAIRAMMNAPKKVLTAKKPEEPKPVEAVAGKEGIKGTIHKPKGAPGATGAPAAGAGAKPGDKKSVKSEKLSSSWANDEKKRGGPTTSKGRSDAAAPGAGRSNSWKAPGGGRGGRRGDRGAPP